MVQHTTSKGPQIEKNTKVDTVEETTRRIQEKMSQYLESNNKDIKMIKDQVRNLLFLEES